MPTDNPTHAELVERLREDATKLAGWGNSGMGVRVQSAASFIESLASRIKELEAENKRLREALTPFAEVAAEFDDLSIAWGDHYAPLRPISLGTFRRARAVLGGSDG